MAPIFSRFGPQKNDTTQGGNVPGKTVSGHSGIRGWVHFGLGIVELVPIPLVAGAAGAVDAGMYVQEGEYGEAAAAGLSVIPGEKFFAVVGKTIKYFKDAREAEAAGKEAEKLSREAKEGKGGDSVTEREKQEKKDCPGCSIAPVVLHSGVKILHHGDFTLPGLLPTELTHTYVSNMAFDGPLGRNRISPLDACLAKQDDGTWLYRMGTDRTVVFDRPAPNPGVTSIGKGFPNLFLSAGRRGGFHLKDDAVLKHFVKFNDGICRLAEIRDLNDNTITFHRETDGLLTRIERSDGFAFLFENDAQGRRTATTLRAPTGETRLVTRYAYDARGNLVEARNSYAKSRRYEYDEANRLLAYDDGVNERCEYSYDAEGRVCAVRTPGGRFDHTFSYEPDQRATTLAYTARPDAATRYTFDTNGMTLTETNGLGHVRRYERNSMGTLLAEIDGEGNRTAYSYDAFGNVRTITDPEGRRTTHHYNAEGGLEKLIDPAGNVWTWEYDARGNLVATCDPLGYRTDFSNDAAGLPTAIMRHDGLIERRTYDVRHNLMSVTDFRGGTTQFERDAFGRVIAIADPADHLTRYAYEETHGADFWTATSVTRADSIVLTRRAKPDRATVVTTDGGGRRKIARYGPFDLLEEIEDSRGGKLRFAYDHERRLVRVVNALGRDWAFDRDAAGRVARETDLEGTIVEYRHDKADRLTERRHPDGTRLVFQHDRSGLLAALEAWETDARDPDATRYRYDPRGLLVGASNSATDVALERDGNGRIIAETCHGRRIESTYDCCGNRIARRVGDHLVETAYDPMGELRAMAIAGHAPIAFSRDATGRELRRDNGLGFRLDQAWDAVGQLLRQRTERGSIASAMPRLDASAAVDRSYAWTLSSAPSEISDARWGETAYRYDANGQVTETRYGDGEVERFAYDLALNIAGAGDSVSRSSSWVVGPGGQVEVAHAQGEVVTLAHDARCRVVERRVERAGFRPKTWRYQWDALDRLSSCETPEGDIWTYAYDPFGRRISKTRLMNAPEQAWVRIRHPHLVPAAFEQSQLDTWPERPPGASGSGTEPPIIGTRFLWDENVVAEEATLRLGGSTDWDAATRWHHEPGTFRPIAKETSDGRLSHLVTDHLGTPREMLDESGHLSWSAEQRLWGGLRRAWVADNDNSQTLGSLWRDRTWGALALQEEEGAEEARSACPIRFLGQWQDAENGLVYNRFRYYDPVIAQYISPDPIGILAGVRRSGYVAIPTILTDAFGLAAWAPLGSGICIAQKFAAGSPEANELAEFVGQWNNEIIGRGGRMTAGELNDLQRRMQDKWRKDFRKLNCCGNKKAGHVPDAAAGNMPYPDLRNGMVQSNETNSYLAGITGDLSRNGQSYTHVWLRDSC